MDSETSIKNKKVGVIILAGGESKRMGSPKQLLRFQEQTLLQKSLRVANDCQAGVVIIVLGAGAEVIKPSIPKTGAEVIINPDWQEGMASSIRHGVQKLLEIDTEVEGAIVMVCDQPFVTAELLNNIVEAHHTSGKAVVASSYENTFGPPVYFQKALFPELLELTGDTGARSIISKHIENVELIPFPKGSIDVDTTSDYEKLSQMKSSS